MEERVAKHRNGWVLSPNRRVNQSTDLEDVIFNKYGAFYPVFEDLVIDSETTLKKLDLSKKVAETLLHVAQENVKVPKVEVTGHLYLTSTLPDGISVIKNALKSAEPQNRRCRY